MADREYTVGWICALPIEVTAARAVLDDDYGPGDRYRPLFEKHPCDKNIYHFGAIGKHNILIAYSPLRNDAGIAATVVEHMLFSFPLIRIVLMVGIGVGIPGNGCDPRPGDIVVGTKLVQYDLGSNSSNEPPPVFLNAISSLQQDHKLRASGVHQFLSEVIAKDKFLGFMLKNLIGRCDYTDPLVHYGIIASGNQGMEDAGSRDRLGNEHGAICFETEAAGLIDNAPCLVIRGICDYIDSRRNEDWEGYAATAATVYAKELLGIVPPDQVYTTPFTAEAILAALEQGGADIDDAKGQIIAALGGKFNFYLMCRRSLPNTNSDGFDQRVFNWLSRVNYATKYSDARDRRFEGTGLWFLKSPEFAAWQREGQKQKTLFCPGVPGAGKTVMSSIVTDYLWDAFPFGEFQEHRTAVAYLYCSYGVQYEQKPVDLLSALVKQLVQKLPLVPKPVRCLYDTYRYRETRPSFSEMSKTLLATMRNFSRVFIIVDALDEYEGGGAREILSVIRDIQNLSDVRLMVTSREIADIPQEFEKDIRLDIRASEKDVRNYLGSRFARGGTISAILKNEPTMQEKIVNTIVGKAGGSFRYARKSMDLLSRQHHLRGVRRTLESLEDSTHEDNK